MRDTRQTQDKYPERIDPDDIDGVNAALREVWASVYRTHASINTNHFLPNSKCHLASSF